MYSEAQEVEGVRGTRNIILYTRPRQLLWMNVFNMHCHVTNASALYWFTENQAKKDPNSVCSFVYDFISRKSDINKAKKIYLFSDSAGGQNKNKIMFRFCSWLSKALNIQIEQIFPVRGHSYCVCDHNFGLYGVLKKKQEKICTPEAYLKLFKRYRQNPIPFEIIDGSRLIKNWNQALNPFFKAQPTSKHDKFQTQKDVRIHYSHVGILSVSKTFNAIFEPFQYWQNKQPTTFEFTDLQKPIIKQAKINDLKSLMEFLSSKEKDWFEKNVFLDNDLQNNDGENQEVYSDDDYED